MALHEKQYCTRVRVVYPKDTTVRYVVAVAKIATSHT